MEQTMNLEVPFTGLPFKARLVIEDIPSNINPATLNSLNGFTQEVNRVGQKYAQKVSAIRGVRPSFAKDVVKANARPTPYFRTTTAEKKKHIKAMKDMTQDEMVKYFAKIGVPNLTGKQAYARFYSMKEAVRK